MPQVVVWTDARNANENTNAAETEIVALSNGNFVQIWRATENSGIANSDGHDIIGRLFNPIGEPLGAEFLIAAGSERHVGNFDAADDGDGGIHITYEADTEFSSFIEHKHITFSASDEPLVGTPNLIISDTATVKNGDPKVVVLADGNFQVHYQAVSAASVATFVKVFEGGVGGTAIKAIESANYGGLVDGEQAIAVAKLSNGNVAIVEHAPAINASQHDGIYLRVVDADGANVGFARGLSDTLATATPDLMPDIAAQGDGFVMVWQVENGGDKDIAFMCYNAAGAQIISGPRLVDNNSTSENASAPRVAVFDDGKFVIVWVEENNLGQSTIRAQMFNVAGGVDSTVFEIAAPNADAVYSDPTIEVLPDGRMIIGYVEENVSGAETAQFAIYDARSNIVDGIDGRDDVLTALEGASVVRGDGIDGDTGEGANDTLYAFGVADELFGQKGNDLLVSGAGHDLINGGAGRDTASFAFQDEGVNAKLTSGLVKNSAGDKMFATLVDVENLNGSDHNDRLNGDDRANVLRGGNGEDVLFGGEGRDKLFGGDHTDTLIAKFGGDSLFGQDGDDMIRIAGTGNGKARSEDRFSVDGGDGYDELRITNAYGRGVEVDLAAGTFTSARSGTSSVGNVEAVATGSFDDIIKGDGGANRFVSADGDDRLFGRGGGDFLNAGAGNDFLNGGSGFDYLLGGDGDDKMIGGSQGDTLVGQDGSDLLFGEAGDDKLDGGKGEDILKGGAGDDRLIGGPGRDLLDGGKGFDTVDYSNARSGVTADLAQGGVSVGGGEGIDTFVSIEAFIGSEFSDHLSGDQGANEISGLSGNDTIRGRAGKDKLTGGDGDDRLIGGEGLDTLDGGADDDRVDGGTGRDLVDGDTGDDIVIGGEGQDQISGSAGNDLLFGGNFGGTGDGSADIFFFNSGEGTDTIGDFEAGLDQVVLGGIAMTAAEVLALGVDTEDGAVFEFSATASLIFADRTVADLSQSDFYI